MGNRPCIEIIEIPASLDFSRVPDIVRDLKRTRQFHALDIYNVEENSFNVAVFGGPGFYFVIKVHRYSLHYIRVSVISTFVGSRIATKRYTLRIAETIARHSRRMDRLEERKKHRPWLVRRCQNCP
jgi:hypothetical protein